MQKALAHRNLQLTGVLTDAMCATGHPVSRTIVIGQPTQEAEFAYSNS